MSERPDFDWGVEGRGAYPLSIRQSRDQFGDFSVPTKLPYGGGHNVLLQSRSMSLKATLPALFVLLLIFPARPSAQVIIEDADPGEDGPDDDVLVIDPDSYGSGSEPILVVPFAASSASSAGLAGLLEQYIIEDLNQFESFAAISLDSSPPVEDVSASLYYAGCPEGDERGCQLVLGELARVSRVVSGTLHTRDDPRCAGGQ